MTPDSLKRFQPSGINSFFYGQGLDFSSYINLMQGIIAHGRRDLNPDSQARVIHANSPFEWRPKKSGVIQKGILFVHGITDSPYIFSSLATHFQDQGFLTRGILLPGHGTVPGDLLDVNYQAWLDAVAYGIRSFAGEVNHLYLAGFSLGAALALYHALKDHHIKGLVLFSPTFKIKPAHIAMLKLATLLRKKWLSKNQDGDYAKYESLCCNAVLQAHRLNRITLSLKEIYSRKIPLFIAMSEDDYVNVPHSVIQLFKEHATVNSKLLLYTDKSHRFNDPRIEIRPAAYPDQRIIDISHVAIPIAPDHPHYGMEGDYKHLLNPTGHSKKEIRYGEKVPKNLRKYKMYRLTYNPDFEYMISAMNGFFD